MCAREREREGGGELADGLGLGAHMSRQLRFNTPTNVSNTTRTQLSATEIQYAHECIEHNSHSIYVVIFHMVYSFIGNLGESRAVSNADWLVSLDKWQVRMGLKRAWRGGTALRMDTPRKLTSKEHELTLTDPPPSSQTN